MTTYTEEQKVSRRKASQKYLSEKVEDIKIRVPKEDKPEKSIKEYFKKAAGSYGLSLNQYAIEAMKYCADNKQFSEYVSKAKADQQ